jgi:hypothetical protein
MYWQVQRGLEGQAQEVARSSNSCGNPPPWYAVVEEVSEWHYLEDGTRGMNSFSI